jgi:hypothetical protein
MAKKYRGCPKWVYDMREATKTPDVIAESEPFCDSGMMPSSVVLRKHEHNQFVSHVKVYPQDEKGNSMGKPSYAWGHYFTDFDEAVEDYKKRCENYEVDG